MNSRFLIRSPRPLALGLTSALRDRVSSRAVDQPLVLLQIRLRRGHRIAGRVLHSITSSARATSVDGISGPSALAA